jgi:major membrane immunogen (membrane-anchored lipoprotein)
MLKKVTNLKKRTIITIVTIILLSNITFCQTKESTDKIEIKQIVDSFMSCIIKKDSIKFYSLFHNDPIVWIGVIKNKTHEQMLKKDSARKNYFESTYQEFYRLISDTGTDEEKFYNITINEDGCIAAVTFDYSFWKNQIKSNWGKESWGLIKIQGKWKITSVLFSLESEKINHEPNSKKNDPN